MGGGESETAEGTRRGAWGGEQLEEARRETERYRVWRQDQERKFSAQLDYEHAS